jgi:SagB-type dehydrogenase family enzyme
MPTFYLIIISNGFIIMVSLLFQLFIKGDNAMITRILFVTGLFLLSFSSGFSQGYDFLVREAETKMLAKDYQGALTLYEKAFESGEFHYNDFYNAACAHSMLGNLDGAFQFLEKALDAGFYDKGTMEKDPDLESLHREDRWQLILSKLQEKLDDIEASFPESHPEEEILELPEPKYDSDVSVEEALKNRRSIRTYDDTPLSLQDLSQLLWSAYGITKFYENAPAFLRGGLRTAASAGARYPLELYVVVRNVTDLPIGVYWYKSGKHHLVKITEEDRWDALSEAAFNQPHFETASAAIVYSAIFQRNMEKYGERGRERYVCMDLGHSGENVYLQAYTLNIGTCAIGAFVDLWVKKAVGMTKEEEPLYIMPLGKLKME